MNIVNRTSFINFSLTYESDWLEKMNYLSIKTQNLTAYFRTQNKLDYTNPVTLFGVSSCHAKVKLIMYIKYYGELFIYR